MHFSKILDGKQIAAELRTKLAAEIAAFPRERKPGLAVVLVGDDPASAIYVRNKARAAKEVGINAQTISLPANVTENELLQHIGWLAGTPAVDGILVQLPLPPHIDKQKIIEAIPPHKDVDGFHPLNVGRMLSGGEHFVPCTPNGIMKLLQHYEVPLAGKRALVIGCSAIVGRPTALLLSQAGATVTVAHRLTVDLPSEIKCAEIVVSAAGCPNLIRGRDIRGSVIIDVGINRLPDGKIVGDAVFEECASHAAAITPVPGGVGPMTIACLLENTVESARRLCGA